VSKFPQFKVEKLKMKIARDSPSDGFRHRHLNIGLELGLDLDLHY
jgi:hypothetical protein